MNRLRILSLAGAGAGALVLAGAAVAITASAAGLVPNPFAASGPNPSASAKPADATRQQWCQAFAGHLASDLGKTPQQVNDASIKAFGQTVDDAVKAGKLTQQQGADLKSRAAGGSLCSAGFIAGPHGGPGEHGPGEHGRGADVMGAVASVLGITGDQLRQDLKNGQTVQQLAAAKGYADEASFRTALVAKVKTDLDAKVKSGAITQAQEDALLKHLQSAPVPGWSGAARPHGPHSPGPTASPATT